MIRIRPETPADYARTETFITSAFATAKVSDGMEAEFVRRLRASEWYLPSLSLLMEEGGEPVGHIMLSRLPVRGRENLKMLLLAPLAVRLDKRGQGLGAQLAREALRRAAREGYEAVCVLGDPAYYGRFGFARLDSVGLKGNDSLPAAYTQVLALKEGALSGPAGYIDFLG